MKTVDITGNLRKEMEKVLDKHRLDHTIGVAYTAASLAFVHGADKDMALTAGMLHDCAKNIPDDEKLELCKKYGIELNKSELANPSLIHAKLGEYLAKSKYGVDDEDILNAIRYHTTGKPAMSLLEKIIYVADYIEPNRKPLPELDEIRKEAYRDLDLCVLHILSSILDYLNSSGAELDPMTNETFLYYDKLIKERGI